MLMILSKVLPKETSAMIDYYPLQNGELSFKKGDPLTIIEARLVACVFMLHFISF